MLWGEYISKADFEYCYNQIVKHESKKGYFLPLKDGEAVLIGKWMFNYELSIVECAKSVSFDCKSAARLGKASNFFGKEVFEKVVRSRLDDYGWNTVKTAVRLKKDKQIATDIDLLAFKNGILLIGQLKVAHCERSPYQIWKASLALRKAQEQVKVSLDIINNDMRLIRSIFVKEGYKLQIQDIKQIVPIVITSSNYFMHFKSFDPLSIISLDMFDEILYHTQGGEYAEHFVQALMMPSSQYSFSQVSLVESTILTDDFKIVYEDIED